MAELNVEEFNALPEKVKTDYEKVGEVYRPALEGKVTTLKQSLDGLDGKLKEHQKNEETKLKDAETKAFERLKKEGKTEEVVADLEKRMGESAKQYEERISKILSTAKKDKRDAIVASLVGELATDSGKKAFARLIEGRIDYDPETGKTIFLNEDGSASSLDIAGFKSEISKSDIFAPVMKSATNTGGAANGNHSDKGSAPKTMPRSEFEALPPGDRAKFMKAGGRLTN